MANELIKWIGKTPKYSAKLITLNNWDTSNKLALNFCFFYDIIYQKFLFFINGSSGQSFSD